MTDAPSLHIRAAGPCGIIIEPGAASTPGIFPYTVLPYPANAFAEETTAQALSDRWARIFTAQSSDTAARSNPRAASLARDALAWEAVYKDPPGRSEPSYPRLALELHPPFWLETLGHPDSGQGEKKPYGLRILTEEEVLFAQGKQTLQASQIGVAPSTPSDLDLPPPPVAPRTGQTAQAAFEAESGLWIRNLEDGIFDAVPPFFSRNVFGGVDPDLDQTVAGPYAEYVEKLQAGNWVPAPAPGPPPFQPKKILSITDPRPPREENGAGTAPGPATTRMDDVLKGIHAGAESDSESEPDEEPSTSAAPETPSPAPLTTPTPPSSSGEEASGEVELLLAHVDRSEGPSRAMPLLGPASLGGRAAAAPANPFAIPAASQFPDLDAEFQKLKPSMAMQFGFELDKFQKEAILCMERGQSVFVAAHTSAGKTVVAEYAFALAAQHCTRAVYTSPIKTISNQKYRDFKEKFDVGLLTGDIRLNPEAPAVIMTTEILRTMLYRNADMIRDIEWVIFDEVHYVNDEERGVVWEEAIIMLPPHVNLVFLSATVPNVEEFAGWVGRTKRRPIYIMETRKRPVPLEHNLYFGGELFLLQKGDEYRPEGLRKARQKAAGPDAAAPGAATRKEQQRALPTGRGGTGSARVNLGVRNQLSAAGGGRGQGANSQSGGKSDRTHWLKLIDTLKQKELLPLAVFCFSKKRCDQIVDSLGSLDFTTGQEKAQIFRFFERAASQLKGSDKALPQIVRVREMLLRGVGVHHAGLLPLLKEVVEMLFCQGFVRVLFCTETFAMGVNAPTRTVAFQQLRKHDGKGFRYLDPGEYTQMAGRAGRRGLDSFGLVIIPAFEEIPEESVLTGVLRGKATTLQSQFRLTYNMLLNLLRVEDLTVEDMLRRSFAEFHAQKSLPEEKKKIELLQEVLAQVQARPWPACLFNCSKHEVASFERAVARLEDESLEIRKEMALAPKFTQYAKEGRVVLWRDEAGVTDLGVVCRFEPQPQAAPGTPQFPRLYLLHLHHAPPGTAPASSASPATAPPTPSAALAAGPTPAVAKGGANGDVGFGGFKLMKKRGDDSDDDVFGGGGGSGRRGGFGGGGIKKKEVDVGVLPRIASVSGAEVALRSVRADEILAVTQSTVKIDGDVIDKDQWPNGPLLIGAVTALLQLRAACDDRPAALPLAHPQTDLGIRTVGMQERYLSWCNRVRQCHDARCARCPSLATQLALVRAERRLVEQQEALKRKLSDDNLQQMPEFGMRVSVLTQLGHLSEDRTVTMKGRATCEIRSGDELLASELIFRGMLGTLSPEEAAAVLSALVFQERTDSAPRLTERLTAAQQNAVQLAKDLGAMQRDAGMQVAPDEYAQASLNWGLAEVVYEWARGTSFHEICALTDVMEGTIVRTIVRLEELCREVLDCARVMGNPTLYQLMDKARAAIKRDVIFAASLYLS